MFCHSQGVLLLSLLSGEDIQDQIPTVPQTLPSVVQNFINKYVQLMRNHICKRILLIT